MAVEQTGKMQLFRYKAGNSIFHRCPAWCKILCVFGTGCIVFLVPPLASVLLSVSMLLTAFYAGFSLREQLVDLIPVVFYATLLYVTNIFTNISVNVATLGHEMTLRTLINPSVFIPSVQDAALCIRLILVFQITSILFRTTTSLALRQGITLIETTIRKILPVSKKTSFAETFSFFLLFIPRIIDIWTSINYAWKARRGKNGIRKIATLIPVLISLCMHTAWKTDRAIRNRHP